ncbi:MAG: hypothetical protein ABR954_05905 [Dehalococcoidales bacterium]
MEKTSIIQIRLAEFNQLREEINVYHDHQKEEIYFAMLVFAGVFATLFSPHIMDSYSEVLLVFPFVFASLAFAYADRTVRILRIATYIHQYLRENLVNELGTFKLLQWEVFKKYRVAKRKKQFESVKNAKFGTKVLVWFKRKTPELPLILDVMRVAQFVMPGLFCILMFVVIYSKTWDILHIMLTIVSTVVGLSPIYFFMKAEETSGIELIPSETDLEEWEKEWRSQRKPK